mgnify:CR=1 FL=1
MDQNPEKFEVIRNIEKLYEEVFTRKGMGSFMKLAWNNVKGDFHSYPNMLEVSARLMIEELLVYAIVSNGKEGYNKIENLSAVKEMEFRLKPYEKINAYYKNYIDLLIEYFKNNPEKKSEIFKTND